MKKLLLLVLILISVVLGYTLALPKLDKNDQVSIISNQKKPILRVALVADSHNENYMLAKALRQAQGMGINFVIGLGDYTNLGTVKELSEAKQVFDLSGLQYYVIGGDRDGWDSRQNGLNNSTNFAKVFGSSPQNIARNSIQFVLLDNSDIYLGISDSDWNNLKNALLNCSGITDNNSNFKMQSSKLCFVFAHKTPFHPESSHVMGEDNDEVANQANQLIKVIEENKIDGFFSGDMHFFAKYLTPAGSVKITTIGAVSVERNFQGPRFATLTIYDDYTWEVEDVEIR